MKKFLIIAAVVAAISAGAIGLFLLGEDDMTDYSMY